MGVSWVALTLLSAKSMPVYRDPRHWPGKECNKVQYTRICYSKGIYTNIGQYNIYPGTVTARDLEISAHFLQRIYKCQGFNSHAGINIDRGRRAVWLHVNSHACSKRCATHQQLMIAAAADCAIIGVTTSMRTVLSAVSLLGYVC